MYSYISDILNGSKHGKGTYYENRIIKYKGKWKNRLKHGNGFATYYNKYMNKEKKYNDLWVDDERYEKGTLYNKDGSKYYEGEPKNYKERKIITVNGLLRHTDDKRICELIHNQSMIFYKYKKSCVALFFKEK